MIAYLVKLQVVWAKMNPNQEKLVRFIQHWCGEWNAPGEKASNRELHHTRTIQYILYTYCMYTVDTWISNMRKQKEWLVLRPGEKHPSSSEWSQQLHPAHNSWSHKHTCMMHKAWWKVWRWILRCLTEYKNKNPKAPSQRYWPPICWNQIRCK